MTSPLRGFSSCGAGHPHRPERRTSASRRSSGCSNSIESVAWMPRPSSARYDSPPIKVADGVTEAASVRLHSLIIRLHVVNRELTRVERKLDELCALIGETGSATEDGVPQRDVAILKSLPGIGRINLAALLAEASGPLSRRDYQALRTLSGVAPVTKRSGKSHIVVMRYAAHIRLRNTVYHWARIATQHDPKSRARYAALRRRGHSHGRAIRGVADRLLALACVLLQRQTLFDPRFARAG
jgi:transposase